MAEYKIQFSKARQARGLPCYGVFEIVKRGLADEWLRGVSAHHTEEEAEVALAKLEAEKF